MGFRNPLPTILKVISFDTWNVFEALTKMASLSSCQIYGWFCRMGGGWCISNGYALKKKYGLQIGRKTHFIGLQSVDPGFSLLIPQSPPSSYIFADPPPPTGRNPPCRLPIHTKFYSFSPTVHSPSLNNNFHVISQ